MAKTKTSKRKRPVDEDNSKQRDRLRTIQQNSSKTVQTPISKFVVPISEINKRKLENSFKGNASAVKKFTGKQTKNWKLLSQSTQHYVSECLDTGVRFIISKAHNEGQNIDDIQEVLTDTIQFIKDELKTLKAPAKTYGDYRKITKIQRNISEELRVLHEHEDTLREAIREEKREVKKLEKELKRLKDISNEDIELHPFLSNFKPTLNIPSIR